VLDLATISDAALSTIAMVCFRSLPVVAYFLIAKRVSVPFKSAAALISIALAGACYERALLPLPKLVVAYTYLLLATALVPRAALWLRRGWLSQGAIFVGAATFFFVVPAIALTSDVKGALLVIGWDITLSAYSYCVEMSKTKTPPSWPECCFFLLVNPTLVYTQRGTRVAVPGLHVRSLWRCTYGTLMFFAVSAFIWPLHTSLNQRLPRTSSISIFALFVTQGLLRFIIEYWRQAGLANFQIGLLRQAGYVLPERFTSPLQSRSLLDFWRRWNTYVGQWLLRYIFWPLSFRLGRMCDRRKGSALTAAVSVIITFAVIGILHDAYPYAAAFVLKIQMTEIFVCNGLAVVLTIGLTQLGRKYSATFIAPQWFQTIRPLGERIILWAAVIGSISALKK
jgi:hypothetical protein